MVGRLHPRRRYADSAAELRVLLVLGLIFLPTNVWVYSADGGESEAIFSEMDVLEQFVDPSLEAYGVVGRTHTFVEVDMQGEFRSSSDADAGPRLEARGWQGVCVTHESRRDRSTAVQQRACRPAGLDWVERIGGRPKCADLFACETVDSAPSHASLMMPSDSDGFTRILDASGINQVDVLLIRGARTDGFDPSGFLLAERPFFSRSMPTANAEVPVPI